MTQTPPQKLSYLAATNAFTAAAKAAAQTPGAKLLQWTARIDAELVNGSTSQGVQLARDIRMDMVRKRLGLDEHAHITRLVTDVAGRKSGQDAGRLAQGLLEDLAAYDTAAIIRQRRQDAAHVLQPLADNTVKALLTEKPHTAATLRALAAADAQTGLTVVELADRTGLPLKGKHIQNLAQNINRIYSALDDAKAIDCRRDDEGTHYYALRGAARAAVIAFSDVKDPAKKPAAQPDTKPATPPDPAAQPDYGAQYDGKPARSGKTMIGLAPPPPPLPPRKG